MPEAPNLRAVSAPTPSPTVLAPAHREPDDDEPLLRRTDRQDEADAVVEEWRQQDTVRERPFRRAEDAC